MCMFDYLMWDPVCVSFYINYYPALAESFEDARIWPESCRHCMLDAVRREEVSGLGRGDVEHRLPRGEQVE